MQVEKVLRDGIDDGTQIGAQVYVSHRGELAIDLALGEARAGVPMTRDTMMTWFSMTKAVTSVAVAQQWERGALDIEAPVVRYIPEFGAHGKDAVTLRHLLTHTAGIPTADGILEGTPWRETNAENLARIYAAPLDYEPGTRAGYHAAAGMTVLGEIVARVSNTPYSDYVRQNIFQPLDMADCWVGMPEARYEQYGDRIGIMNNTERDTPTPVRGIDSPRATAIAMPGGNGRGPMYQLARMYEHLDEVLAPVTIAAISARHRTDMEDETFGMVVDWGLGLAIDTYAMGRHCSHRAFGHGGHQSSVAFRDPEHDIVVAVVCNGMPGRDRHSARLDAISSAVYVDLGIAKPADDGRRKPYPTKGL
ncbi:MAG TPA: serine hydrolase domain-containing protein [Acidimicrobiia bacterium]|jgi:CubicO group peptidase (beta-lactamase class C family)|nr:serine hydrolase domain-containing protein [Acidimicrobiia bacterium]